MSNIQKTLDSLQPYVIGIRYLEGTPLVDVVFKEGWAVQEDPKIKMMKGNEEMNYYMLFSEVKGIGLDELLGFVDKTIKLNILSAVPIMLKIIQILLNFPHKLIHRQ